MLPILDTGNIPHWGSVPKIFSALKSHYFALSSHLTGIGVFCKI
jgi:hypothetical protein